MTELKTWQPDSTSGGIELETRRAGVVAHLKAAVNAGYYHIDQQLEIDILALKKKAGEQKAKMLRVVKDAETKPAMTIIRKYWMKDGNDVLHHLTETIMRD